MSRKRWALVILVVLAGMTVAFTPLPARSDPPVARIFQIQASQFAYSPAVLRVNPGDTITFELVSTDVVHGLYVDGYGASVTADPGQTARLTFIADKPGTFRFRCNITCGALHPFMIGELQIGSDTGLWRAVSLTVLASLAAVVLFPHPTRGEAA